MVSKNNLKNKLEQTAARTPHYGIRKLSVGVASVLISTTLYMGATTAKADTLPSTATEAATTNPETASSSSSTQTNATADNTAKTTVPTTASSTDTSVSTTSNAQTSTTNTTAGATSSDKSGANNNSLVTNNVESTKNTTAQTQPKPDVVTSDKANVDNQVGSNVENKATTTTDTNETENNPGHVSSLRWVFPTQSGDLNDTFMPGNKHTYEYQPEHTTYYHANNQSVKINYVDDEKGGATVKTDTLTGKTDEIVKAGIEIPDGYEVDGQVPSEYSFKAKTVHLKHSTVTVNPYLPKTTDDKLPNNPTKSYPKGVAKDDLNKTVVRTIKVTTPDGKTTTTRQTVDLNRVAVVDEVTGQVTYSKWSLGELDRYDVPSIEGYTPSQDRVNMEVATSETKDSVVEISYTPNGQSINITYVDDDKGKTTVDSYILAGKTDETVKTCIKIPDGYEVEGQVPTDYTFKAKDNTDITVRLKHKLDKGTETKTVSRIVEITLPDGQTKTIKQEQTLKRSKTTDLVTGDVVYGEWSKAEFDEVVAPEVDGYKPSQAKVEKETVDGNSSDQVVKITYKKVKSDVKVEAKPTVEAKHEAKVQVAPKVEAKASAKPQAKAQPKFVTTELPQTGEKQSKGTTIGAILVGLGSLLGLGALGKRKEK